MTKRIFIGIDPGLSGGIASLDIESGSAKAWKTPGTDVDVLDLLIRLTEEGKSRAIIERVGASPQMGVVSAFTFGKGYGGLLMALAAARIPFDLVAPVKWQTAMGVRTPKDLRAALGHKDKNINKQRAQQLFPAIKVTHAIADALLLAEYARRLEQRP